MSIGYKSKRFEMGFEGEDSTYFSLDDNFELAENEEEETKKEIFLLLKKHFKIWE